MSIINCELCDKYYDSDYIEFHQTNFYDEVCEYCYQVLELEDE